MRMSRLVALALSLTLAACGGAFYGSNFSFFIGAFVDGHSIADPIRGGQSISVFIRPGQSIAFDADEPVHWQFLLGASPVFQSGSSVIVNGVAITLTTLSASRAAIDTAVVGPAGVPVFLTLRATSSFDAALVSTISIRIG